MPTGRRLSISDHKNKAPYGRLYTTSSVSSMSLITVLSCLTDAAMSDALRTEARGRLHHALQPGTWANHRSHLKCFIIFCTEHQQNPMQCSIDTILAFTQSLVHKGLTARNINNYLSLKTCFIWMKCNGPLLDTREWTWNLQSIPRIVRDPPSSEPPYSGNTSGSSVSWYKARQNGHPYVCS